LIAAMAGRIWVENKVVRFKTPNPCGAARRGALLSDVAQIRGIFCGGTEGSNPVSSRRESAANLTPADAERITRSALSPRDMRQHPIGTGPFKFVDYKSNQYIKLARNPDY